MSNGHESQVIDTFLALTDTLVGDFDALDFLMMLAVHSTELLDVSAAGVILTDGTGGALSVAAARRTGAPRCVVPPPPNSFAGATLLDWYRDGGVVAGPPPAALDRPRARRTGQHLLAPPRRTRVARRSRPAP